MKCSISEAKKNDTMKIADSTKRKNVDILSKTDLISNNTSNLRIQKNCLTICYYVTGHGYGHATRVIEICRYLLLLGHRVIISTTVPAFIFTRELKNIEIRKVELDRGVVQANPLSVDPASSLELYKKTAVDKRDNHIENEAKFLQSVNADIVVADIVPLACAAAKRSGCKIAVCTNFSWDFIFSEYLLNASQSYRSMINQISDDYSQADLLIRLPGYTPMPAFKKVIDVPLVVRKARKTPKQVREELGISMNAKLLMFCFGGQTGTFKLNDSFLPKGWLCLLCTVTPVESTEGNSRFIRVNRDAYTPDLIQASDVVLGKLGYGMSSEVLAHSTPVVFIRREWFNEEPFLRRLLYNYGLALEMSSYDFYLGEWEKHLNKAYAMKQRVNKVGPPKGVNCNGGQIVATLLEKLARGDRRIGKTRVKGDQLRDAIVYGFMMKAARTLDDREVGHWYENIHSTQSFTPMFPNRQKLPFHGFELLEGNTRNLEDVHQFLALLAALANSTAVSEDPALTYAQTMFDWKKEIFIGRAPGRLDVMGGIADYSGSLVLQYPIKEACKVAIQVRNDTEIHIASTGSSDFGRRSEWHGDIKLLFNKDGDVLPYKDIAELFKAAHDRWASYIVGVIVVLLKEKNIKLKSGLSVFINSQILEGRGMASSAALEVATMYAAVPALGLALSDREYAILSQKVENYVALRPCGIMDPMTCVFGKERQLLVLLCRPAQVKGYIDIPSKIRFWGIDSGISCPRTDSDYTKVRIGAFMGRRIIFGKNSKEYLTNISPSEFRSKKSVLVPNTVTGEDFVKQYGNHDDAATTISEPKTYNVRNPTKHAIEENFRVQLFHSILEGMPSKEQISLLGELMYQSHWSYTTCGLGSNATDQLIELVLRMGTTHGLYGAKITGGGQGGTVCVLGSPIGETSILKLVGKYQKQTNYKPYVFAGSSCGAKDFGYISVRRKHIKKRKIPSGKL